MNFDDVEKLVDKARKKPGKAILIIFIIILFSIVTTYVSTFLSKKAEQHATIKTPATMSDSKNKSTSEQKRDPLMLPPDFSSRPIPEYWGLIICIESYPKLPIQWCGFTGSRNVDERRPPGFNPY